LTEQEFTDAMNFTQAGKFMDMSADTDIISMLDDAQVAHIVSNLITFSNSNIVAYLLANENTEVGKALYEELVYWYKQ